MAQKFRREDRERRWNGPMAQETRRAKEIRRYRRFLKAQRQLQKQRAWRENKYYPPLHYQNQLSFT